MIHRKLDPANLIDGTSIFLAEGLSEAGFMDTTLAKSKDHIVYCFGGLRNLPLVLKSIAATPGIGALRCLGVMLDAETDFESRVQSVAANFRNIGVPLEERTLRSGIPERFEGCRIGVYISPGNEKPGRIEDLAIAEISQTDSWDCITTYNECLMRNGVGALSEKAIVQTYISSRKGDLCGLGRAFESGILNVSHPAYAKARSMIEDLAYRA